MIFEMKSFLCAISGASDLLDNQLKRQNFNRIHEAVSSLDCNCISSKICINCRQSFSIIYNKSNFSMTKKRHTMQHQSKSKDASNSYLEQSDLNVLGTD